MSDDIADEGTENKTSQFKVRICKMQYYKYCYEHATLKHDDDKCDIEAKKYKLTQP